MFCVLHTRAHLSVCTCHVNVHCPYVEVSVCSLFVQLVRGVEVVLGEGSGCSVETRLDTRERFIPLLLDKYKVRGRWRRNQQREEMGNTCIYMYLIIIAAIPYSRKHSETY